MKKNIISFLISVIFIVISSQSFAIKNETYLICKKEDENQNQNLQNFDNKKLKENFYLTSRMLNFLVSPWTNTLL